MASFGARRASSSVGHLDVDASGRDVERDDVAGAHERQRSTGGGLGGDVQHDGAVRGAAHPAVADPDHVAHALREQLLRQRHVRHLGHAGVALRAAAAQHQHRVRVDVEVGVVDAGVEVLDRVEDDGPAAVLEQVR